MRRLLALALLAWAAPAPARDLWGEEGAPVLSLRSALKATALVSRAPDDRILFPQRLSSTTLWRLRLEPQLRPSEKVTLTAAYEQRLRVASSGAGVLPGGGAAGLLPSEAEAPWRVRPLDDALGSSSTLSWRHELDRAAVALHLPFGEVTAGRQAVGWGRGAFFSAVDLFSPFSPTEVDREWRRGIDALRADVRLGARASVDAVAAFGPDLDNHRSILAVRARGYAGPADLELVAGRRAEDLFAGLTGSGAVLGAEVHGELAVFRLPTPWPDGGLGDDRLIPKAVLGGSYHLGVGEGLHLAAEWHYNGFGVTEARRLPLRLFDGDFRNRFLRGDFQTLGRHTLAAVASYPVGLTLAASLQVIVDPRDGSGLVAPSISWDFGEGASILAAGYFPWGAGPEGIVIHSLYGLTPLTGIVQVRVYD
jgi:hypothetical protein